MSEKTVIETVEQLENLYHQSVANKEEEALGVPGEDMIEEDNTGEEAAAETVESGIEAVPGYDMSWLLHEPPAPLLSDAELESTLEDLEMEERLVDAAFAEFPREMMLEVVIGRDDRVRIRNTIAFPWRCICHLHIESARGTRHLGTGWLCGPHTVITAGHCVYMHSQGGWVNRIVVSAGRNGLLFPFGSVVASSFRSVVGWTQQGNTNYDYGAIILPSNNLGNRVGWFGFASLSNNSLRNLLVNLSGYPGDKPSGTQWFHANRITSVSNRKVYYQIDTVGGQSGSPIWRIYNGHCHAVAIHTTGFMIANSGTRITRPVFDNLLAWKR